jgi:hypothetical protein
VYHCESGALLAASTRTPPYSAAVCAHAAELEGAASSPRIERASLPAFTATEYLLKESPRKNCMQKLLVSLSVISSGLWLALACSEEKTGNLLPATDAGSSGDLPGNGARGGSSSGGGGVGGSGGVAGGSSGTGGAAGMADMPAGSGGQDAGVSAQCVVDGDCDDGNACTVEHCEGGACLNAGFSSSGTSCGNPTDDICTRPDTCDGAGLCQSNHNAGTTGMLCGSMTEDGCTHPDTCDAQGVCSPNDEPLGTACGSPAVTECSGPDQCDENGQCSTNNAAVGLPCGDDTESECARHDVCGTGVCLPNDVPNGTACTGGSCTLGQCISDQPVGCPIDVVNSVPATIHWSSVGSPDLFGGDCDEAGTPDYALLFTAPSTGTFRFVVHGLIDSTPYTGADTSNSPPTAPPDGDAVISVAEGSCAGPASEQAGCNDDGPQGGDDLDSQLDLTLSEQQVVTVYLNERTQRGGGTGTLSITLLQ